MKKYIITFLITAAIFLSAFFVSDKISVSRIEQLNNTQEKISLNILATETRFALLQQSSCETIFSGSGQEIGITQDLNELVNRIKFLESELGSENEDVKILKQRYTLLQIKDYLLVRELSKKCDDTIATVVYFHDHDCSDCRKQSIVLDQIRQDYDYVRVYWMDASLGEVTLGTLERLYGISEYPSIILGEEVSSGFVPYKEFSQKLVDWADDRNIALASLSRDQQELVQKGREFLLKQDSYFELDPLQVSFKQIVESEDFLIYEYSFSLNGEMQKVGLQYIDDVFVLLEK